MAEATSEDSLTIREAPGAGEIPKLSGDLRPLIPRLGLREYWYPAVPARRVTAKRPLLVSMLGEDICLFRTEDDDIAAIQDVCPHRGARLSEGDCHWKGTVACPYHGWVYNKHGENIAVLGEGPESTVCGKKGTEAKVYRLQILKGIVFAWIGDGEPGPIEEDVPEEFFDPDTVIYYNDRIHWRTNWEVAIENSMDAHVNYLHRDHLQAMLASPQPMPRGASGAKIAFTGNGFKSAVAPSDNPLQDHYANGLVWPKRSIRRYWAWFFKPFFANTHVQAPMPKSDWWGTGHRLPGMFRAGIPPLKNPDGTPMKPRTGGLFGLYTRWPVAVAEWRTRIWYFATTKPTSKLQQFRDWLVYWMIYRWVVQYNFSQQDMSVMENLDYESPEKLSGTDAEIIQWRRLVVTKRYGGRGAEFDYHGDAVVEIDKPQAAG